MSKNPTHWGFVVYEFDKNQWMASFTKMISWDATFDFFYMYTDSELCSTSVQYYALWVKSGKIIQRQKNTIGCKIHLCMTPKQLRWNNNQFSQRIRQYFDAELY